jgi:UDP-N-acetylglucosamine--N-acetylmuramyl-(pentapeptide) pyrophosphoryl-undecaprenol N-acetylglucosamine transferase
MKKKVIMIAGGGTGGHIYPGIAIARALQKADPGVEIRFVGTDKGLETKIVPREGFALHLIYGGQLNFPGEFFKKIKTLLRLPVGIFQSLELLIKYRPYFVLGVGGYASGPFVLLASLIGFRTAIWEPNALPGLANRWLSRFVKKCFLVFEESKKSMHGKNMQVVGMPVRAEMESKRDPAPRSDAKFHILHYGGSQGSRAIGRALCQAVKDGGEWLQETKIVHQTGSIDYKDFLERYRGHENLVEVHEFIFDMPKFYDWADLVVCRGGASTLNEIAAFGLPSLIIPLPAADAHQEKNAEMLVRANAACMIAQKDLTPERLIKEIQELRNNVALRDMIRKNVKAFHRPRAAEAIAQEILKG